MGVIEEVGKEVTRLKKGYRVIVLFPVSCGHCWYCNHGLSSQIKAINFHTKKREI